MVVDTARRGGRRGVLEIDIERSIRGDVRFRVPKIEGTGLFEIEARTCHFVGGCE